MPEYLLDRLRVELTLDGGPLGDKALGLAQLRDAIQDRPDPAGQDGGLSHPPEMHEHHLGHVAQEVVVDRRDLEATLEQNLLHGLELVLQEDQVAHDHRSLPRGHEDDPGGRPHGRNDGESVDDDLEVVLRKGELELAVLRGPLHTQDLLDLRRRQRLRDATHLVEDGVRIPLLHPLANLPR